MLSPMASKKTTAKKTKDSGRNIAEAERKTEALKLRLSPETAGALRAVAAEHGWSLARTVQQAMRALNKSLDEEHEAFWAD